MKKNTFLLVVMTTALFSCQTKLGTMTENSKINPDNPFLKESTLPFSAPDFSKITNDDYQPALEEGMRQQLEEVNKIADNKEAPTFENTIVALEKSGQLLHRVNMVFDLMTGANTNDTLQKLQEEIAPKLAAHSDEIHLNSKLFKRIKTVYDQREKLNLDPESKRLVEYYYQEFVLAGANLSDADKAKMKKLNKEEASLSTKFSNQLIAAAKDGALVVKDKKQLAGLSKSDEDALKTGDHWTIPLQNTTQQPLLASLTDRATRKALFEASWTRNEKGDSNDTRSEIIRLAQIRAEQASLLGFKNYAEWKLQDQMAKTPAAVDKLLNSLAPSAVAKVKVETAENQAMIDKTGGNFKLEPYDWELYSEKVRKEKYDLDESQIKPYFELNTVLEKGVFYAANQLYGLTFKERKDLPVYQKDVRVFEVFDKDGKSLALFYCDYYKRDNKAGGAWMSNLVDQSFLLNKKPVVYNVCNFTKPAAGQPALISYDDVTTMFHEFGHALHGMFANQKYPSLSGANTARDFVEFPSQFNENWALYPTILKNYAVHYQTGKVIPQALIDKIKNAATFNQGYALTELLEAAILDMKWHEIDTKTKVSDVDTFEVNALKSAGVYLEQVPPRYRSSYFLHIWANGYSAGYYAYLWTEMLAHDAFAWFEENGGLTRANGQRFRDMVLSKGNTEDYATMYRAFRGKDPSIEPMEKARGFLNK